MRNQKARWRYHKSYAGRIKAPICPYCGRVSVLRSAEYVYGQDIIIPGKKLYVCSGYPVCDAYVGVSRGTKKPLGSLANGELRHKRILAHRLLKRIVEKGIMNRKSAYEWLAIRMNLPYEDTHIGYFSNEACDRAMKQMREILEQKGKAA